jgi:hypothetical protein
MTVGHSQVLESVRTFFGAEPRHWRSPGHRWRAETAAPLVLAERRTSSVTESEPLRGHLRFNYLPILDYASVPRPDEQDCVVRSLLAAAELVQPAPVVIGGPGGFGKTVLALQVCRDDRAVCRFDAILWVHHTTPDAGPVHLFGHTGRVLTASFVTAAETRGQTRLVEMNQQVLRNLDRIIDTLDDDAPDGIEAADVG